MQKIVVAAFAALALTAAPALAHHEGEEHDSGHHAQTAIAQDRALEIAAAQGVARVREVELRRGLWEVEGRTAEGRRIEVEINAETGEVVKREIR